MKCTKCRIEALPNRKRCAPCLNKDKLLSKKRRLRNRLKDILKGPIFKMPSNPIWEAEQRILHFQYPELRQQILNHKDGFLPLK